MAPRLSLLAFGALAFVAAGPWRAEGAADRFSARCTAGSGAAAASCAVTRGEDPFAQAEGGFEDAIETTGWGQLLIKTRSSDPGLPAFAAGYLEGYLTGHRTVQHLTNALKGANLDPPTPGVIAFVEKADAWWAQSLDEAKPGDRYWDAVRFIHDQLAGLIAGVNAKLGEGQGPRRRPLSRLEMLLLNSLWDMDDIKQAVNSFERTNFSSMDMQAISMWTRRHGHCSSIVKLLPDGSELFAGHNTWMTYNLMLRVFKRYEFGSRTPIAMSSYPGVLSSQDDFYQVGSLVVMETTLPNYNNDLLERVKPETLLFWIRAMAANQLATSGPEWMDIFMKHNSGTYNNMWMVVDYGLFTPGKPLKEGVLTVGEQLPGYFYYEDQTRTLSYGYWPSYNAAVFPETVKLNKQDVMTEALGDSFSYQLVERAQIFRRDQGTIASDGDMQRVMRYNRFQSDPIAQGDSCKQLACRSDLAASPKARMAFGAIDAKYTSSAHVRAGRTIVVSGPTHDDQPAFDWGAAPELAAATSHVGQSQRHEFPWMVVGPDLLATPWPSTTPLTSAGGGGSLVAGASAAAGLLLLAAAGRMLLLVAERVRGSVLPDGDYKHLQGPPAQSLI